MKRNVEKSHLFFLNDNREIRNKHFQVVACVGILSTQCAIQQIFAIACLKPGIQRFNDYSDSDNPSTGFFLIHRFFSWGQIL